MINKKVYKVKTTNDDMVNKIKAIKKKEKIMRFQRFYGVSFILSGIYMLMDFYNPFCTDWFFVFGMLFITYGIWCVLTKRMHVRSIRKFIVYFLENMFKSKPKTKATIYYFNK